MKIFFVTIVCFITLNSFSQSISSDVNDFTKGSFKLQYPKSWRVDTSNGMGVELYLFSPLENVADKFSENISVIIQDLTAKNIDLEKYKQITESQIDNMATDGKLFESLKLESDKGEYYKVSYAMTQGKFRLKITSYCIIKNEKAYLITFGTEFDKYDQYKKEGEGVLKSFCLIK